MSTTGVFLGLDVGTQGTKAVAIDAETSEVVARASASYGLIAGLGPGAAEQHPQTWVDAVAEVCRKLLAEVASERFAGVGVSGQQHGFVPLDEAGDVIRPAKLWCDTATAAEARELSATYGHAVPAGFTASKILWLERHEPDNWKRLRTVLLPHDYINYRLTGRFVMEPGDASGTGFFDPRERRFALDEVRAIDDALPDMLPELIDDGQVAGTVTADAARWTGLPEGIPVAAGGGDNMMSAIGSGAACSGVVVVSLGTSGTVFTRAEHPVVDPEGAIAPFCDSTGAWLPLLCVMNLTGVTEEVRTAFGADLDSLTREASEVAPGSDGLLFVPYLQGERVPDLPEATGVLTGIRPGALRRGHLFRAAMEGTSLNLAWGGERLRHLGVAVDAVRLVGGAARNDLWRQILADCFAAPVSVCLETESAALGGAIQALWTTRLAAGEQIGCDEVAERFVAVGAGVVEPRNDAVRVYEQLGQRLRDVVGRVFTQGA